MIATTILFFLLGLIVGSFLNVLVYRLHDAETILGRSHCRHCRHQIRWYDNIPLFSFLLLRGACRDCETKISWQYPLMEFLTGVVFALVGICYFSLDNQETWRETIWLLGILSLILVIAFYDLRYMEIPVLLLIVGALWTFCFFLWDLFQNTAWGQYSWQEWSQSRLGEGLIGGLLVALLFFILVFISHETWMGWGDVWLGGIAGMIVGYSATLFMLTLAFGLGACFGLVMIFLGKKGLKSQVPFAPFLLSGVVLTLFLPSLFPQWSQVISLLP